MRRRHDRPEWYRDAVIYTLDVKTFYDSDGDGWGDFQGVIDRLAYLDSLGIDCLWLRPFFPSPLQDNGYDVADYYGVDERLGSLGDFREFVAAAHDRGIRVLCDMVFNHTSVEHRWFQRARRDPESRYHDYYLWTSDVESAYSRGNIFPDYEDGVWSYDDVAGKHYYHQFYGFQPDLNVANPAVREEIYDVLQFWLDLGVDGFRIDAAHPMTEVKGHDAVGIEDPAWLFGRMRAAVREVKDDAVLLAEADDEPEELARYFGADGHDGFDMLFNFVLNQHMVYALAVKDVWPLYRSFEVLPDVSEVGHWANFLRNHDEFNLLKLPPEAFEHARDFFGGEAGGGDSWIFGRGHRLRLADLFVGDDDRIALAHALMFAMPGTPVILSGDEIGMGADLSLPERESVRTPMQWSDDPNGGFSTADPDDVYNGVIDDGPYGYDEVNVADQLDDPESLLSRIERIVDARHRCPEIGTGEFSIVDTDAKDVWAHRFDQGTTVLTTVHSFADEPREVTVDVDVPARTTTRVLGPADYEVTDGAVTVDADACGFAWLRSDRRGQRVPLGRP